MPGCRARRGRPGGAAALNEAGSGRRAWGAEVGRPPLPGLGKPSFLLRAAPASPLTRPPARQPGLGCSRHPCPALGSTCRASPPPTHTPGRVRAPGEVVAGSARTPRPEVLVDLGGGRGGDMHLPPGSRPLPSPTRVWAVTLPRPQRRRWRWRRRWWQNRWPTPCAESPRPAGESRKVNAASLGGFVCAEPELRREPRQGAGPEWRKRRQLGSSALRASSLNRLLSRPLQPGGFVPCPFHSDSRVHCSLRADHCEILSAPAPSQPCESSIFIKARSFKKQNDMLRLSWKNRPRRHAERKGLFLIITWELALSGVTPGPRAGLQTRRVTHNRLQGCLVSGHLL